MERARRGSMPDKIPHDEVKVGGNYTAPPLFIHFS